VTSSGVRIVRRQWVSLALASVLFMVAFCPRFIYPVSRPAQWYVRSVRFIYDLTHGNWGSMIYSEHPGVTTMWLSGIALRLAGVTPEEGPDGVVIDPANLTARETAIGVFPLALAIAGLILLIYGLLEHLFDRTAALSAALLVALDPFFIANSKVLHVDGLLTALMTASALALLVYLKEKRWRWVVLSGALGGLALRRGDGTDWRRGLLGGAAWAVAVCLVYFAFYPAMWVDPLGTIHSVYGQAALRLGWTHPNPLYFLGQPIAGDPGPTYYPVVWGCKLTALVSVFAVVGLLAALFDRSHRRWERIAVGLLFAFAFFFTLQMTIGAKKMPRYLLPAFPALDIVAGLGLSWWAAQAAGLKSQVPDSRPRALKLQSCSTFILVVALCLLLQAVLVLPLHPYYGTHFNELMGTEAGIWALSTQWQGEGLDIAAPMLNGLPGAEHLVVGSHMPTLFRQVFVGQTVDVDQPADWFVFGINNAMRSTGVAEGTARGERWDFYRRRRPWATISLHGAPYVWVYQAAAGPQHPLSVTFEPGIHLIGYDIACPSCYSGQLLRLQLYWQAEARPEADYTVFVHALDRSGQLITQQDNPPVRGTRPTSSWEPGAVVVDPYDLQIPGGMPPGELTLTAGMYRWQDGTRLAARSAEGTRLPDDRVVLARVHVTEEVGSYTVWIVRALGFAVLLSAVVALSRQGRGAA